MIAEEMWFVAEQYIFYRSCAIQILSKIINKFEKDPGVQQVLIKLFQRTVTDLEHEEISKSQNNSALKSKNQSKIGPYQAKTM